MAQVDTGGGGGGKGKGGKVRGKKQKNKQIDESERFEKYTPLASPPMLVTTRISEAGTWSNAPPQISDWSVTQAAASSGDVNARYEKPAASVP